MCSRVVRSSQLVSALALFVLTSACGSHFVTRGTSLYHDGQYVEAADVFERTEMRLRTASSAERARFGLYRGATFLKLGDVPHAARWLGYSRSILRRDPAALGERDAALLDASLEAVAHVSASAPAPSLDSEVATAPPAPSDAAAQ